MSDPHRASALHVEQSGEGTPVVLLHSSGLSGRQWRRLTPQLLERGLRPVVVDFTGHGDAEPWPEPRPFSFRDDVGALAALLETLPPVHLVGHSYGGLIGLLTALARPGSVRSMVLFDPVAFGTLDRARDADALQTLAGVQRHWGPTATDRENWLRMFVDFWGGAGAWAALKEEARQAFRRVGWVVREGVTTLSEDRTPASAYAGLTCPVQLLSGQNSPLAARRVIERLSQALPHSSVSVLPGAGHMAPLSHADAVNDLILSALGRMR